MSIIIIGGSGFIGTCTGRLLNASGTLFKVVDRVKSFAFPSRTVIADVTVIDSLRAAIPEGAVIINLAAEHRDDVRPLRLYDDVNVGGATNLCIVAREKMVNTIVFTSSVAVYGFAPDDTDETGEISPFNDYGRTKFEAEQIYRIWQAEAPAERTLIVVRPTVVFGERNRGNVYNLLRQISSGKFMMVGDGLNRKSMAYVENVAAFLQFSTTEFKPGLHIYNYIDKPDGTMNYLVATVNRLVGKSEHIGFRLPFAIGYAIGMCFDAFAFITGKKFTISAIRVRKFCSNSVFETSIAKTGFVPPVSLAEALERTISHEFIQQNQEGEVFYSE